MLSPVFRRNILVRTLLVCTVLVCTMTAVVCPILPLGMLPSGLIRDASGEEPLEQFIEGLKQRGYFDVAFEYLERSENSGSITSELKGRLDFEKAQVLLDGLNQVRNAKQRKANLDQAQSLLQNFIETREFHPYASTARKTLGDLLLRRAEIAIQQSKQEDIKPEEAAEFKKQARGFCEQAASVLLKSRESLKSLLERLDPKAQDATRRALRTRYEDDFLRVRLLQGLVAEQTAVTYEKGSAEEKKNYEQAAALYEDFAKDYPQELSRYRALLYAARSYNQLGTPEKSKVYLREIADQPNAPMFRGLKRDAALLGSEIWFAEKPPQYQNVVKAAQPLLETLSPNLAASPQWLELKLVAAKAYRGLREQLEQKTEGKTAEDKALETLSKNLSVQYIREVSRVPGEYRDEAQRLLLEWGVRGSAASSEQEKPPESLAEAMEKVDRILGDFESDRAAIKALESSLKRAAGDDKQKLQQQLDETRQSVERAPARAIELMRTGLQLAEADTQPSDLEGVFYKMAFCYYALKDFDRSLVVSEHLISISPNSNAARGAAGFGVQSLLQLSAASDASSDFEVQRLRQLCDQILRTWPSDPVAVKAAAAMIQLALRAGDADAAEKYLQRVPDGTEGKDALQMNVGLSIWATVRRGERDLAKARKSGTVTAEQAVEQTKRFRDLRVRAQNYVATGVTKLQVNELNANSARSVLALSQLYADSEKMDEAIAVLEHPIYGPLTLIGKNHPLSQLPQFKASSYQTALRAYIGSLGSASDPQAMTDKARKTMTELKAALANDPRGKQRLIAIYLSMANDVKKTMAGLESAEERAAFQKGLNAFLDAVQQEANDVSVLVWVSSTNSSFADAALQKNDTAQAAEYFGKAAVGYQKLLKLDDTNPDSLSDAERVEMTRRLAQALGKSGKYKEAIDLYVSVLSKQSAIIDVQVDAAETLQAWGAASKDLNAYARAMAGTGKYTDEKTKRKANAIWGWGRLAQTVIKYPKYRDRFIEARYNLALCRYEYAKLRDNPKKYMKMAEKDVMITLRSDPKLGGPAWRAKFNVLLKAVQKELGKSTTGLPAQKTE